MQPLGHASCDTLRMVSPTRAGCEEPPLEAHEGQDHERAAGARASRGPTTGRAGRRSGTPPRPGPADADESAVKSATWASVSGHGRRLERHVRSPRPRRRLAAGRASARHTRSGRPALHQVLRLALLDDLAELVEDLAARRVTDAPARLVAVALGRDPGADVDGVADLDRPLELPLERAEQLRRGRAGSPRSSRPCWMDEPEEPVGDALAEDARTSCARRRCAARCSRRRARRR